MSVNVPYGLIQPFLAGRTHAQVATLLVNSGITAYSMPLDQVRAFFYENELLILGATFAGWDGPIANAIVNPASPPDKVKQMKRLLTYVFHTGRGPLRTDQQAVAAEVKSLIDALVSGAYMTAAQRTAFYAIGGGQIYLTAVAADVTASVNGQASFDAVETRRAAIKADDDRMTAAWNKWSTDRDVWIINGGTRPVVPLV